MPNTTRSPALCTRCQEPTFKPRVDLNSLELYVNSLSKVDPFDLDTPEVSEMIILCDGDLEDYEADLMPLRSQILFIEEQQARLKAYKARLRSLASPIRKLPNEVLASIFDSVCASIPNLFRELPQKKVLSELSSPMITYLPALSISATCARWRSFAVSFPSLWSRLKLEITSGKKTVPRAFIATIDLFLARSAQCPLSISLEIFGYPQKPRPFVLDLLLRHTHRWRTFKFIGDWHIPHFLEYQSTRYFTILESLDLYSEHLVTPKELNIFRNAPNLRELVIYGLAGDLESEPIRIPCSQLTGIEFNGAERIVDILNECPNITCLKIRDSQWYTPSSIPPMIFNAVKTVTILQDWDRVLDETLKLFTFPALQELYILGNPYEPQEGEDWSQLFTAFLSRSSCRITTLVISASALNISTADLVSSLQNLPYLVTFEISDHNEPDSESPIISVLISSLRIHSSRNSSDSPLPLIPKLRYLVMEFGGTDFDDMAFIAMISSRSRFPQTQSALDTRADAGVDCLRSVVMRFRNREVSELVYEPLRVLDRMGLRVVVRGINGIVV